MPIQLDFILRRLVEMAEADPALRTRQPWQAAYERDYGWLGAVIDAALRRRRHQRARARRRHPRGLRRHQRRGLRGRARTRSCARPSTRRSAAATSRCAYAPMVELLELPRRERVQQLHRLRRRPRLHAPDQPGGLRHPAPARDRQQRRARVRHDEHGGTITHLRAARLPRRRPAEADPDLEPHRPPAAAGRRQLQRRRRRCWSSPRTATSRPCACSCCTTTTSASSPTPRAPSRRSSVPRRTAGPSSA